MTDKLTSRKFWMLIFFGGLTFIGVMSGTLEVDIWKWFVGLALPGYFIGQGIADGKSK